MAELLLLATALCVLGSMALAYARTRDPLHPLMFIGPMLLYVYIFKPGRLLWRGDLQKFLTDPQIEVAQLLFFLGIAAFCTGALWGSGKRRGRIWLELTPARRQKLVQLGSWLGCLALAAYWTGVFMSGGFFEVYGGVKGRFNTGSGWINEMVNLSIPAAALLLLAWQGDRRYRHYFGWALVFASPMLIHGLLGTRRGPTFMILASMLIAWYIRRGIKVSLWKVVTRFGLIGALLLFLIAHRQDIHLGAEMDFSLDRFLERAAPTEVRSSDDTVFSYGFVAGVHQVGRHYWGLRYFTIYVIRPIPRQIWPTKYKDLGLGWMMNQSDYAGISERQWESALGWVPSRGSAAGFAADLFLEFSWAGVLGCLAIGFMYGRLWRNACRYGELWTLLFVEAAALSVYVPTQSVSAVFHRFLFMAVPTILVWRSYIGGAARRRAMHLRFQVPAARPLTTPVRWSAPVAGSPPQQHDA